jgi:ATP-dependent exoDNAse (exonuclease V) alpha subunit
MMMKEYFKSNNGRKLKIDKLIYDDNSQDFYLMKGMPLIARKNRKDLNIFNNEKFICQSIKKDSIIIKNELDEEIEVPIQDIRYTFYLGYAITCHKAQGDTIEDDYAIWEWEKMHKRLKYVSLSRATNKNNIYIN